MITGDETVSPPRVDLNRGAQVFVGNQPATVLYGGRAGGGPGNDRIDFVVPAQRAKETQIHIERIRAIMLAPAVMNVATK